MTDWFLALGGEHQIALITLFLTTFLGWFVRGKYKNGKVEPSPPGCSFDAAEFKRLRESVDENTAKIDEAMRILNQILTAAEVIRAVQARAPRDDG